jgi:hypothetical protein
MFEHLLVARLENIKRQESMGEKQRARERHDGDMIW